MYYLKLYKFDGKDFFLVLKIVGAPSVRWCFFFFLSSYFLMNFSLLCDLKGGGGES